MYKLIQKNKKKLLAFFGVFLMIVFILPSTVGHGNRGNPIEGTLDGRDVFFSEISQAHRELEMLNRLPLRMQGVGRQIPALAILGPGMMQIQEHPDLFFLLKYEAQKMGIVVSKDRLESMLTNQVDTQGLNGRQLDQAREALHSLLMVQGAFGRSAGAIKASRPLRDRAVAEAFQEISIRYVEFDADAFTDAAPQPTDARIQAHFDQYKDTLPIVDRDENPFGFGYRYPNRVKLQYITLSREQVKAAVAAQHDAQRWEVEAYKHYQRNPQLYPADRDQSSAESNFEIADLLQSSDTQTATRPTTQPFEDVRARIIDRLQNEETDKRMATLASRINSILVADYNASRPADSESADTDAPTSLGAPYESHEYLQRLASRIQQQFNVLPAITSLNERFLTREDLEALPGIGQTALAGVGFPAYATSRIAPFQSDAEPARGERPLALFEPSRTIEDLPGNVYIFRVTAADPSHPAQNLDTVKDKIVADLLAAEKYKLALDAANQARESASQSGLQNATDKAITTTAFFGSNATGAIAGVALPEAARSTFVQGAFDLLAVPPADSGERIALIELPPIGKILLAELADIKSTWRSSDTHLASAYVTSQLIRELEQAFAFEWYDYESVKERLHYQPIAPRNPS